jgi:hypothetical protein
MSISRDTLRRLGTLGLLVSLLVAIASCVGLLASFLEPTLELPHLYRISTLTREIGFCMLAAYIVAGFALPTRVEARATAKISNWTCCAPVVRMDRDQLNWSKANSVPCATYCK